LVSWLDGWSVGRSVIQSAWQEVIQSVSQFVRYSLRHSFYPAAGRRHRLQPLKLWNVHFCCTEWFKGRHCQCQCTNQGPETLTKKKFWSI